MFIIHPRTPYGPNLHSPRAQLNVPKQPPFFPLQKRGWGGMHKNRQESRKLFSKGHVRIWSVTFCISPNPVSWCFFWRRGKGFGIDSGKKQEKRKKSGYKSRPEFLLFYSAPSFPGNRGWGRGWKRIAMHTPPTPLFTNCLIISFTGMQGREGRNGQMNSKRALCLITMFSSRS